MLIALTGGIGTGKSVVSRLLLIMGYPVYDCDTQARRLMTADPLLRQQLTQAFGASTYLPDGSLNKPHLSSCIFSNPEALATVNSLVHPAVGRDLQRWKALHSSSPVLFFESAIFFESGFARHSSPDQIWSVSAPIDLRIRRIALRDHLTPDQIAGRIANQMPQEEKDRSADCVILNDDSSSLIAQVEEHLGRLLS